MRHPYAIFIGKRYARVKRKNHFISFISMTSMLGIAVGVMALITVISVMNGFSREIRKEMLNVAPHITLRSNSGYLYDWRQVFDQVAEHPQVVGAAPYLDFYGMLSASPRVRPVIIKGIDSSKINQVFPIENNIIAGSLSELNSNNFGLIIGKELALALGVWLGDKLSLIIPDTDVTPAGVSPRVKRIKIVAVYNSGTQLDGKQAFINLKDASLMLRIRDGISGIQIKINDELLSKTIAHQVAQKFDYQYWLSDWTTEFHGFFEAIKMEKTVMWCILLLIIAVAAFNLVSTLVMMVTDKRPDIAILRAMGASSRSIMAIFVTQGVTIGVMGTILGLIFGLLLAYNVTDLVELLQALLNVEFISEDFYIVGFVPSEIKFNDVFWICLLSIFMSLIATLYPAFKAARVIPAEALRYE